MIVFWGTRVRSHALGHVAELCAGCGGVTDHELCEVIHAPHFWYVPTERGKVMGYSVRCGACRAEEPAAPDRYLAMTRKSAPLETLQRITNPGVLAELEERKDREERARKGDLGPRERLAVMQESLVGAERAAAERASGTHVDRRSGAILGTAVAGPGLALVAAAGAEEGVAQVLVAAGLVGLAVGVAFFLHSLATDVSRFVRRRLRGAIHAALHPFQPSPLEIQQLLTSMRAGGWVLGHKLRVDGLTQDLYRPSVE